MNFWIRNLLRLSSYISIGMIITLMVWITWNILYWLSSPLKVDDNIRFSVAQYVSAVIFIFPSFWLNRRFTFKDKKDRHDSFAMTTARAYAIYLSSPLAASLVTYGIQFVWPWILKTSLMIAGYELPVGRLGLQVVGLSISLMMNYLGQMFLLYARKPETSNQVMDQTAR